MRIAIAAATAALLAGTSTLVATVRAGAPAGSGASLVPAVRAAADMEGTWTITVNESGRIQLNVQYEANSNWGRSLPREDLAGVPDAVIHAAAPTLATFRIQREAGVFDMEGSFREGRGAGRFVFRPNHAFGGTLRALGVRGTDGLTERQLMTLALADVSAAGVRELVALELGTLDLDDVISLHVHDVTPAYVREMRRLGVLAPGTVEDVVALSIHDVTPELIRALEAEGYRGLSKDDLLQMGIHDVTPAVIREYRALGYDNLAPRELVAMQIHDVTPEFIRQARAIGWTDLTPEALVELQIHDVTPAFVREMEAVGYRGLERRMIMQMALHDVTAAYVRELRELGYENIPARQLVEMAIHDVTPAFIRQVRAAGFRDVSAETLVRMKIHGIEPDGARSER